MSALSVILAAVGLLLLIPVMVLSVQVLAAVLPARPSRHTLPQATAPLSVSILMPAHNESAGLGRVLEKLLPQLSGTMRLLLVADNCTDNTAAIARGFAATHRSIEVIERSHAGLRGKGYALEFGVRHLQQHPPEVVIVMDADCEMADGALQTLAARCMQSGRPIQGLYLMTTAANAGLNSRLARFAWVVKNHVRALGDYRLGLPCQLMGTGMAFGWAHISQAALGTGHIVEDMSLGLDLAIAGHAPLFCEEALVVSSFPTAAEGVRTQRTRWEHGHLGVILSDLPSALWKALRLRNLNLFAMAMNLSVPPLAFLALLLLSLTTASAALWFWSGLTVALQINAAVLAVFGLAVVLAWLSFGRSIISFVQLCGVPWYVLCKVPVYFYFLVRRQSQWVRSKREGE